MCDPVTATIAGAAILGAGTSVYMGNKQEKAQRDAMNQAKEQQASQERLAREQMSNANRPRASKAADVLYGDAMGGGSSTNLTGPGGVAANQMPLGKSSLLGQ